MKYTQLFKITIIAILSISFTTAQADDAAAIGGGVGGGAGAVGIGTILYLYSAGKLGKGAATITQANEAGDAAKTAQEAFDDAQSAYNDALETAQQMSRLNGTLSEGQKLVGDEAGNEMLSNAINNVNTAKKTLDAARDNLSNAQDTLESANSAAQDANISGEWTPAIGGTPAPTNVGGDIADTMEKVANTTADASEQLSEGVANGASGAQAFAELIADGE